MRFKRLTAITALTVGATGAAIDIAYCTTSTTPATMAGVVEPGSNPIFTDTATGVTIGLMAGLIIGGIGATAMDMAAGLMAVLFVGIGIIAAPVVTMTLDDNQAAAAFIDGIEGGLVGLAVGGLVGVIAVRAPAVVGAVVGGRRR